MPTPLASPTLTDIHDLKPIFEVDLFWLWATLCGGGVLVLLGVAIPVYLKWRKKRIPQGTTLSYREIALRSIEELQKKGWFAQGEIQKHYFVLSEIFREFLGAHFSLRTEDFTSSEILSMLRGKSIPEDLFRKIEEIFFEMDQVKFAKILPAQEGAFRIQTEIVAIISPGTEGFFSQQKPLPLRQNL